MSPSDESSAPDWPFDQAPNVSAITVRAVLEGAPVLHVAHDADDHGWQFLDGQPALEDDARLISMANALALDPSLREVADLPPGWTASRASPGLPWTRAARAPDAHPRSVGAA